MVLGLEQTREVAIATQLENQRLHDLHRGQVLWRPVVLEVGRCRVASHCSGNRLERPRLVQRGNAPLVVTAPTYNIIDELKAEGDWELLQKYSGFEFDDNAPKNNARKEYDNMMYLERPGCNLCMGNQEKAEKGDTVMATSTRLFQGRVVADSDRKKGESLLASTPVVVLSAILGRTPTLEEYKAAVKGINLTKFAPQKTAMCS